MWNSVWCRNSLDWGNTVPWSLLSGVIALYLLHLYFQGPGVAMFPRSFHLRSLSFPTHLSSPYPPSNFILLIWKGLSISLHHSRYLTISKLRTLNVKEYRSQKFSNSFYSPLRLIMVSLFSLQIVFPWCKSNMFMD